MNNKSIKRLGVVLLFSLSTMLSYGQEYFHGLGLQYSLSSLSLSYVGLEESDDLSSVVGMPGVFYKATIGFDKFAISAYPSLSLAGSVNSETGSEGSFGYALPIVAEYYTSDIDDTPFYFGVGGVISAGSSSTTGAFGTSSVSMKTVGPQFSVGKQFEKGDQLLGVRLAYAIGLNKAKIDAADIEITEDKNSLITLGIYKAF